MSKKKLQQLKQSSYSDTFNTKTRQNRHWFTTYLTKHYSTNKNFGLDIGCRTRPYDEIYNCKYLGIDLLTKSMKHYEVKPDIFADGKSLPFKDNTFDFVTTYSVVPYVKNIDKFFSEMYRVMKPKSIAIIIIMNLRGLALQSHEHFENKFSSRDLHRVLKRHHFRSRKFLNLKTLIFSWYFDLTSVYGYAIVEPVKNREEN